MKYKELHEKYDTSELKTEGFELTSKGVSGCNVHEAALGDFMTDYIHHLMSAEETKDSEKKQKEWVETTKLMRDLLNEEVVVRNNGAAVIKWIGPKIPSLCE